METWIYQWGLLDEFCIHAYWVGRYRESLEASLKLLMDGHCPPEHHERILQNGASAKHKLEA